jgi:uncharacterized protein (TIGR03435 family)
MRGLAVLIAVAIAVGIHVGHSFAAQAPAAFDAVSIKENKGVSQDGTISTTPGRFTVTNSSAGSMIRFAYGLRPYQVIGLPEWADATPYDVLATYPVAAAALTDDQLRPLVQALLADRFGLQVHRETRPLPAFELRLARADGRLGPQLVPSTIDCTQPPPPSGGRGAFPVCQGFQTRTLIAGKGGTLDSLAAALEAMVRQRVLNRTGLAGRYDWNVRWEGARGPAEQATVEEIAAMMTALDDQLGLKLESVRAPEQVIVVDTVRRPTAN